MNSLSNLVNELNQRGYIDVDAALRAGFTTADIAEAVHRATTQSWPCRGCA